jgi:hypothetical protein
VVEFSLSMVLYCGFGLPIEMGYVRLASRFCEYPTYRLTLLVFVVSIPVP